MELDDLGNIVPLGTLFNHSTLSTSPRVLQHDLDGLLKGYNFINLYFCNFTDPRYLLEIMRNKYLFVTKSAFQGV